MAVSQLAPSRYKTKHHRWRGPTCFLYRTTCVGILLQHPKKEYELKMQKKRRRKEETKRGKRKREWRLDHERRPWRGDVSLSLPHSKPFLLCVFPLSSTFSNDFFFVFAACVAKVREEGTDGNTARRDDDEGRGLAHTSISFSFSFLLADVLHKVFSLRAYKNATICTTLFSCKLARQVQSSIWKHASLFQDSGGFYKQCQSDRFLKQFLIF